MSSIRNITKRETCGRKMVEEFRIKDNCMMEKVVFTLRKHRKIIVFFHSISSLLLGCGVKLNNRALSFYLYKYILEKP